MTSRSTIFYSSRRGSGRYLPSAVKITDESMQKYFEAMVAYRIAALASSLAALQVSLLRRADGMSPEEMDRELHRLEDLRRILSGSP